MGSCAPCGEFGLLRPSGSRAPTASSRAGDDSAIVFGWVNAAHQVGAALAAFLGGAARDAFGSYDPVWLLLGAACALAALVSLTIRRDSAHGYRSLSPSPSPSPSGASDRDQDQAPDQAHAQVPSSKRQP